MDNFTDSIFEFVNLSELALKLNPFNDRLIWDDNAIASPYLGGYIKASGLRERERDISIQSFSSGVSLPVAERTLKIYSSPTSLPNRKVRFLSYIDSDCSKSFHCSLLEQTGADYGKICYGVSRSLENLRSSVSAPELFRGSMSLVDGDEIYSSARGYPESAITEEIMCLANERGTVADNSLVTVDDFREENSHLRVLRTDTLETSVSFSTSSSEN